MGRDKRKKDVGEEYGVSPGKLGLAYRIWSYIYSNGPNGQCCQMHYAHRGAKLPGFFLAHRSQKFLKYITQSCI